VGRERERFDQLKCLSSYDARSSFSLLPPPPPSPAAAAAVVTDTPADDDATEAARGGQSRRGKVNGMGTVGIVCVDTQGRMVVALSTGGTPFKRPGRVGDTPLWGSGAYVEAPLGGGAATGTSRHVCMLVGEIIHYMHTRILHIHIRARGVALGCGRCVTLTSACGGRLRLW
jgi:hypothetical protein